MATVCGQNRGREINRAKGAHVTQQPGPGEWGATPQWGGPPPGQGTPPGDGPPPGYSPPPGYGAPPGYGTPPGYSPPGYSPPPGYGSGYGPPGYGPPAPGRPWRPKPGIVPLRPLGLGEIFDGAFQAIRTNPRTMLGVSAIVMVAVALIGLAPQYYFLAQTVAFDQVAQEAEAAGEFDAAVFAPIASGFGGLILSTIVKALATTVLSALLVLAVSEAVLGRRLPPGALWHKVRPRIWAVIGVSLLAGLAPLVALALIGALFTGLGFALSAVGASAGVSVAISLPLGLIVAVLATVYLWVRLSLAAPALLLENIGPVAALRRSGVLVQRSWWRLFGILLLTSIIVGTASSVLAVPLTQIGGVIAAAGEGSAGSLVTAAGLSGLAEMITGTVLTPFSAAVTALLYVDRRMRAEGLDVELVRAAGVPE